MAIDRKGKRKVKGVNIRTPELGYYIIITDAKETEKNYFEGLKKSIPVELQDKVVIKTKKVEVNNFINVALQEQNLIPNFAEPWIVFDRDRVINFNNILKEAERNGISVAWSNPCIEIWFFAYFGRMPTIPESSACCNEFNELFKKHYGYEYDKADRDIFEKLRTKGDLEQAITIAQSRYKQHLRDKADCSPSDYIPCTTMHEVVSEILGKIK